MSAVDPFGFITTIPPALALPAAGGGAVASCAAIDGALAAGATAAGPTLLVTGAALAGYATGDLLSRTPAGEAVTDVIGEGLGWIWWQITRPRPIAPAVPLAPTPPVSPRPQLPKGQRCSPATLALLNAWVEGVCKPNRRNLDGCKKSGQGETVENCYRKAVALSICAIAREARQRACFTNEHPGFETHNGEALRQWSAALNCYKCVSKLSCCGDKRTTKRRPTPPVKDTHGS